MRIKSYFSITSKTREIEIILVAIDNIRQYSGVLATTNFFTKLITLTSLLCTYHQAGS